jgi:hypothetical protein
MRGVDYMNTQPAATLACLRADGNEFVCRYYDASGNTSRKCLDRAEVAVIHAAGFQLFVIYETNPVSVGYFSLAQGRLDGARARAAALASGQPPEQPIFFGVDYDASATDLAGALTAYFNGVHEAMAAAYPVGVYGSYDVCAFSTAHWPAVTHQWQTYAWSGGRKAAGLDLFQYENDVDACGIKVDRDEAYVSGWRGEHEMTEDQVKQIVKDYLANVYGPALELELRQVQHDAVAQAIKTVGEKLNA